MPPQAGLGFAFRGSYGFPRGPGPTLPATVRPPDWGPAPSVEATKLALPAPSVEAIRLALPAPSVETIKLALPAPSRRRLEPSPPSITPPTGTIAAIACSPDRRSLAKQTPSNYIYYIYYIYHIYYIYYIGYI